MNRINESNPKTDQESPRAAQDPFKTAQKPPKTVQRGPKSPQERPKTPPRRPQSSPRRPKIPQEPSWDGLGAILRPINHKIEFRTVQDKSRYFCWVDFGAQNASQNDPKTTPKRVKNQDEKCITFLSLLDPSWTDLEAISGRS